MANIYRVLEERFGRVNNNLDRMTNHFDRQEKRLDELKEEMRATNQRPADVKPYKTRKRTKNAAADQAKNGDSSSARVDDYPTCLTSFGVIAKPFLKTPEKCIGVALVNNGAEAPKAHLPPMEMRMLSSVAVGLSSTGPASAAMRVIFPPPLHSWTLGNKAKKEPAGQTSTSFSLPVGGRPYKPNQGKLWCLILAAVQLVYATAYFWEGGAHCFVGCSFGRYNGTWD